MTARRSFVLTCEHGGNDVPAAFRHWFEGKAAILASHRGYDPGALDMARHLARALDAPLESSTVSRLLVDLNRSVGNPALFSTVSRGADAPTREAILQRYHAPHRERVERRIGALVSRGRVVVHVASHSFTPKLDGDVRRADVAWLYDPRRARESRLCRHLRDTLGRLRPDLRLRRNYPYRGDADGLTTYLRGRFPATHYLGIELEVNQKWFFGERRRWLELKRSVASAFALATG